MSTKILIVEDDLGLQTALTRVLKETDSEMELEWVSNAEEALRSLWEAKIQSQPHYDLVIADIYLTGKLTGLDLWRKCGTMHPHTQILLMSGMGVQEFFKAIGEKRMLPPFLPKPFGLWEFRQATEALLNKNPN